ncbi:MAG: hypothetical protein KA401_02060 [Anaerolineae bacterium]|nr:hypothetical protein [Anaerolineae bacterium]
MFSKIPRFPYIAIGLFIIAVTFGIAVIVLENEVAVAIITAGAAIFASVFSLIWQRKAEKERAIEQQIREKKIPVYEKLISATLGSILSQKKTEIPEHAKPSKSPQRREAHAIDETPDLVAQLRGLIPDLVVWGTNEVLMSFMNLRRVSAKEVKTVDEVMFAFENMLDKIREDLGHPVGILQKGDLLRIFINDMGSIT